jgi:hypothetical protein
MSDFWVSDRTTEPPIITLLSTEDRKITIGLASALATGETIQGATLVASLLDWRTRVAVDPAALVGIPAYNATTKNATQRIDASNLPVREHVALQMTFTVTFSGGSETRAVYVILWVDV